mmetsp:Transcript_19740/g.35599  ORF Transcript_19740/g.35599 Transcript_19740/m.35599 type:complete len:209 (-) Transcript_19740:966-1592(-)
MPSNFSTKSSSTTPPSTAARSCHRFLRLTKSSGRAFLTELPIPPGDLTRSTDLLAPRYNDRDLLALTCADSGVLSSRYVCMTPLPFTITPPVEVHSSISEARLYVSSDTWIKPGGHVLSIRLAVFTVSPNRQKRGMRAPTIPDVTGPLCRPTRNMTGFPVVGSRTCEASFKRALAKRTTRLAWRGSISLPSTTQVPVSSRRTSPPATM